MTSLTLLRLLLVPAAVWLASLAARRWGHSVSGYLGGMPLIGGPITLFLALDHGPEFVERSAILTLAAILAQAAHMLAFAHAARRWRWPAALAAGWGSFAMVAMPLSGLALSAGSALLLACAGLACAWHFLPSPGGDAMLPAVPSSELALRLAAALALAVAIVMGAESLGPVVSGVLLSVPITGSIMPPFTLALYGADAVARLTRGFIVGLSGFTAFFFSVASLIVSLGITIAFTVAIFAALATLFVVSKVLVSTRPR